MEQHDALFVINQDVVLSDLRELSHAENIRSAVILATHRVFPNEESLFREIGANVKIISFSDLLTEADMCSCDETAEHLLLAKDGCGWTDYSSRFMTISVTEKNKTVHKKLTATHTFDKIFYMPGLGVSEIYWKTIGASLCVAEQPLEITGPEKKAMPESPNPLLRAVRSAKNFLKPVPQGDITAPQAVIRYNGKNFIFLSPLQRLRIRPGTPVETIKIHGTRFEGKNIYCMTIHGYDRTRADKLDSVLIFVDGYHPSNYPRSYIDSYGKNSVFAVRTMLDQRWFNAYGRKTVKPPAFVELELFAACTVRAANHVLIALNHAGDWTALINRSDTDELVVAAAKLARNLPQLSFRLRTHPTMNHPAHEGLHASARIEHFVHSAKLANLHTSADSLSDDLDWCDICLSEYSQVLLDALRNGKLCVAVNPTQRRSFMQDYADLGFFHADSFDQSLEILRSMADDLQDAMDRQNRAVNHYNALLSDWYDERAW